MSSTWPKRKLFVCGNANGCITAHGSMYRGKWGGSVYGDRLSSSSWLIINIKWARFVWGCWWSPVVWRNFKITDRESHLKRIILQAHSIQNNLNSTLDIKRHKLAYLKLSYASLLNHCKLTYIVLKITLAVNFGKYDL